METKSKAIENVVELLSHRKENVAGWKKDVNIIFSELERLVKQHAVDCQKFIKDQATNTIKLLKEERANYLQKGSEIEDTVDKLLKQHKKDFRDAKEATKIPADKLMEKLESNELSLTSPGDPPTFTLPCPDVDISLNALPSDLKLIQFNGIKNKEDFTFDLPEPDKDIEEGSTKEVSVHSQWSSASGKFSIRLSSPHVEQQLGMFSMHTRLQSIGNNSKPVKEPKKGDLVLTKHEGTWYRAKVIDLKEEKKICRVLIVDYGNLEVRNYTEIWPFQQELGKTTPFQMIECMATDITDPKDPRLTDARWTFNRLVQKTMQESGGQASFSCKFNKKMNIDGKSVWNVDLKAQPDIDITARVREKIQDVSSNSTSIACRDIRYPGDEIQTQFLNKLTENQVVEQSDPIPSQDSDAGLSTVPDTSTVSVSPAEATSLPTSTGGASSSPEASNSSVPVASQVVETGGGDEKSGSGASSPEASNSSVPVTSQVVEAGGGDEISGNDHVSHSSSLQDDTSGKKGSGKKLPMKSLDLQGILASLTLKEVLSKNVPDDKDDRESVD